MLEVNEGAEELDRLQAFALAPLDGRIAVLSSVRSNLFIRLFIDQVMDFDLISKDFGKAFNIFPCPGLVHFTIVAEVTVH